MVASPKQVWLLVHRTEFESISTADGIKQGQVIRVKLKSKISDITGFVTEVKNDEVYLRYMAIENTSGSNFNISDVETVIEILSTPLFFRYRQLEEGEQKSRKKYQSGLRWEVT